MMKENCNDNIQYLRGFETESEYRDYLLLNAMRGSHEDFPSKHCNKNMLLFVESKTTKIWLITEARTIHPGLPGLPVQA